MDPLASTRNATLLLVGATGLVGRHVLELALADARVDAIVAPVRRDLPSHRKLRSPRVDFDQLPADAPWWRADAVICVLGTTMKKAGSREAFRRVDHDYPLAVARLARAHGTPAYVLNSALGANAGSRIFYNRVKGEVEDAIAAVGFESITLVRPGAIGGERDESRPGERLMLSVLGAAGPMLPRRWRVNPAGRIARAMLEAALAARPGTRVVDSGALTADGSTDHPQAT